MQTCIATAVRGQAQESGSVLYKDRCSCSSFGDAFSILNQSVPRIRLVASCELSDLLWAGGNDKPWDRADPDSISSCFVVCSPAASAGTSTARTTGRTELPSEQDLAHKVPDSLALEGATGTYSSLPGIQNFKNIILSALQVVSVKDGAGSSSVSLCTICLNFAMLSCNFWWESLL